HQEPELSTSYSLYLQNLRVVGTMLAVFEHTRDEKLLDKCDQIVLSWMEFVEAGGEVEMTWYDHAVGARCRVLTQYLSISEEMNRPYDKARFTAMLEKHAEILMRSEEHTSELQSRFDLVCRLLLEKKNDGSTSSDVNQQRGQRQVA